MSADNWTTCPQCNERAKAEYAAALKDVMDSYGKVSVEEFDAARERVGEWLGIDNTFREDYEFWGADEGTVHVSYSGHCSTCNLGLDFKDARAFYPLDALPWRNP